MVFPMGPMGFGGMAGSPYERPEDRKRRPVTPAEALPVLPWQTDRGERHADAVHGKGYNEMSPAEFGKAAQDRANRGFLDKMLPGIFAGSGLFGYGLGRLDDSMFNAELANRSQAFAGKGQPMPDEFMAMSYGGGGAPGGPTGGGVSAADLGASLAEGNTTGMFEHGGVVRREDLRGPNPPGRDEGYVAVHPGEVILNRRQQQMLARALLGR